VPDDTMTNWESTSVSHLDAYMTYDADEPCRPRLWNRGA
jgi:hypothetical protein